MRRQKKKKEMKVCTKYQNKNKSQGLKANT